MNSFVVALFCLFAVSCVYGQVANECIPSNSNASSVVGQSNFTLFSSGNASNQLFGPNSVVVDENTGKVYISEGANNRIQRYNSTLTLLNNASAEVTVFGNVSAPGGCNNNTLNAPEQLDWLGTDLYVADFGNGRVLKISNAPTTNQTVPAATTTFGHPNATSCASNGTFSDLPGATGVAITSNGTLFVSGANFSATGGCYIRKFNGADIAANYPAPSALLGNGNCSFVANDTMSANPGYLYVDAILGHLFAADVDWNRVLLFKTATGKQNLSGADTVFGQQNFTTSASACGATNLSAPYGVFYDEDNDVLIISDSVNDRVVFVDAPITAANGKNFSAVIGQTTTAVCTPGSATQTTLDTPVGVFYASDFPGVFLMVADYANNRTMRFQCTNSTFSGSITLSVTANATVNASANATVNASANATVNASANATSPAGISLNASINATSPGGSVNASVNASSVAPSINTITGSLSASQSNTPSQTGTATSSRSASRTGTNSKTATSACGNGVKDPSEECEGGACCSHRCRFVKANRPCGFRPAGTAKACVRKRRCNGLGVCRPAVIKQNPKRKCKKTNGQKGLCDITTGACI